MKPHDQTDDTFAFNPRVGRRLLDALEHGGVLVRRRGTLRRVVGRMALPGSQDYQAWLEQNGLAGMTGRPDR